MSFIIRQAEKRDAEGIGIVHYQSWLETYRGILDDHYLDDLSLDRRIQAAETYYMNCWVAEVNDEMVGFIHCNVSRNNPDHYEIIALYVFKAYQKMGIGRGLIQKCLETYPLKHMTLWVAKDNINACKAYEKLNFKFTEEKKDVLIGDKTVEILKLEKIR